MMNSKAALSMTKIVIIAVVAMLVATILIFLALPYLEEEYGKPGACDDTCFKESGNDYITIWEDCEHPTRHINHFPNGPSDAQPNDHWQYVDGFEGFMSKYFTTLHELRQATEIEYEAGGMSYDSWHWFDCTAEALD